VQARALTLARQSKAALDAVADQEQDVSVLELREAVNDWLTVREGPLGKPLPNLVGEDRAALKADSMRNWGPTDTGF